MPDKATTVANALASIDPRENGARTVQDPYATKLRTWQKVRKYLRPTSKSKVKVAEAFGVLGVLLYFTGDSKGFERANQSALKADEDNALARLYQVYSSFEQEQFENCLKKCFYYQNL